MSTVLTHLVSQAVDVKCSLIAAVTLLFYDSALKLGDEANHVWPARWSPAKVLYLIIRYLGFLDAAMVIFYDFNRGHTTADCHLIYQITMWFMVAGIISCQFILVMRTYAIWGNNLFVGLYLSFLQVVFITVSCYFCNKGAKSLHFIPSPAPEVVPCIPLQGSNVTLYSFGCIAIFDFHILFFTVVKGFSQYRLTSTPLVRTLYRDGIVYFVILFTVSLSNVILMRIMVHSPYFYMLTIPQLTLHTILITRLVLNMRMAAYQPAVGDDDVQGPFELSNINTVSTMDFRSRFERTVLEGIAVQNRGVSW